MEFRVWVLGFGVQGAYINSSLRTKKQDSPQHRPCPKPLLPFRHQVLRGFVLAVGLQGLASQVQHRVALLESVSSQME